MAEPATLCASPILDSVERWTMLEDIQRVALALGGSQDSVLARDSADHIAPPSRSEQLAFLRQHIDAIEHAARSIASNPRTSVQREERSVAAPLARRINTAGILRAIRGGGLIAVDRDSGPPASLSDTMPQLIHETVAIASIDTPENRWIGHILADWLRDLLTIEEFAHLEEDRVAADNAHELAIRLHHLRLPAVAARRYDPVRDVPGMSSLRDPRYRALYTLHARYRQQFRFAWDSPSLRLAAKEAWLLYEIWTYLTVGAALMDLGWRAVGGDAVKVTSCRIEAGLAKGRESRIQFEKGVQRLSLFYCRAFPSALKGSRDALSRTHTMIPDICLERDGRLLLLDAKFREYALNGSEQDDIVKMHAYRDAIVRAGAPVVIGAWCLFPGTRAGERDVIAYPRVSSGHPFGSAGIGAVRLRPAAGTKSLRRLLASQI